MSREANVFACLVETVVAPAPPLPPLAGTDALAFLERYLDSSPRPNRIALRAGLLALELGPLALGFGARMRRLAPDRRLAYLDAVERGPAGRALRALESVAKMTYHGDDGALRSLGYDPDAVVARAREVRVAEGRW